MNKSILAASIIAMAATAATAATTSTTATAAADAADDRESRAGQLASHPVAPLAQAGSRPATPAADSPSQSQQGRGDAGKRASGTSVPMVLMLVPLATAERDPSTKTGCWARFHEDQNFRGDALTLVGPVDMANMTGPFGVDWKGKISSVETGSKARVLVYDNEDFKDLVANFDPGKQVTDVSKKMGFFDEFSSLKIICDAGAGTGAQRGGSGPRSQQGSGTPQAIGGDDTITAVMEVPPAVAELQGYVSQSPVAPGAVHIYTADGLRKLADALAAVKPDAAQTAMLRNGAAQLQSDPQSRAHAGIARTAFLSATEAIEGMQRQGFPMLDERVRELRQTAQAIDPAQPLLDQTRTTRAFLESSSELLVLMGHAGSAQTRSGSQ